GGVNNPTLSISEVGAAALLTELSYSLRLTKAGVDNDQRVQSPSRRTEIKRHVCLYCDGCGAILASQTLVRFTLLRRAGFVSFSAVITFLTPTARADSGIAARYPGDKNISSDSDVILADDFESYTSTGQLTSSGKWSAVSGSGVAIGSGTGNFFAGSKSIEMTLNIDTAEHLHEIRK